MPIEMKGRRIPVPEVADIFDAIYRLLENPGDYCGPFVGPSGRGGAKPGEMASQVWYLLPIARDEGACSSARSLHHVESPPHTFTEEPDGSLTIRNSIGAGFSGNYYWHGFLTKGNWQLNP
ncbi:MAG: hypothetical protein KGJ09_09310 [Candidatus Omnitrophica bacterium]|nr:hypothetical protein [Candidatus Omnitrophota bacterium]